MKGVSLNFGSIKDTILRHSSRTIVSEGSNKSFLDLFLNEVKESPALKVQYLIYKNIEKGYFSKEYLAERFLNQNIGMISNFDFQEILNVNKELRFKILNNSFVGTTEENSRLYESIHSLIKAKTSKGFSAFDEENQAYEYVIDHLMGKNKPEQVVNESAEKIEMPSLLSWKYVTDIAVNNFNERYSHLSEEEKGLVKIMTSGEEYKKNYLDDLKEENLSTIENLLATSNDDEMKSDLQKFRSKILSIKGYDNLDESIINLYELKCSLE